MAGGPIVLGTDGSRHALRAVDFAAREATARGASLRIVSVPFAWPVNTLIGAVGFAVSQEVAVADQAAASAAVDAAANRAARSYPDLQIDAEIRPGSPAQILLGCASEASMLVVGSRGAGGFAAMMLGSVSRCIATSSTCAAVVVTGETSPERRQIVVGVREPEHASAALRFAFEEAALRHSRLLAVHAWGSPCLVAGARRKKGAPGEEYAGRLRHALDPWAARYPGVNLQTDIPRGHPGRVLSTASATADLVVLGRHGVQPSDAPTIGSALHGVLEHAQGPVAVIPDS